MSERHRRLLEMALARFGREGLAQHLNVAPKWIDFWSQGLLSIPPRKAEALVDLLHAALRGEVSAKSDVTDS
jgi:hypothetical protein